MRKLRNNLFVWVSISFMLGILWHQLWGSTVIFCCLPGPLLYGVFLFLSRKSMRKSLNWGIRGSAVLTLVLIGSCANHWSSGLPSNDISHLIGKRFELEGTAITDGRVSEYGQRVWVEAHSATGDEKIEVTGKLILYINGPDQPLVKAHDQLRCKVRMKELKGKNLGYLDYLRRKGINCAGSAWEIEVVGMEQSLGWYLDQSRAWFVRRLDKSVEDAQISSLAAAMLLGDKRNLDNELKEHFASAGISHLLAVSGLHVGLIYILLNFLLSFIPPGKHTSKIKGGLCLLILIAYALLTGAGPAVNRAVLMLGFVLVGRIWFQRIKIMNIVALAALLLLIVNPKMLFEVGFQLSFSAVAGIILLTPPISNFFRSRIPKLPRKVSEALAVSISAQLATAPLVIVYFGQFPTYFLISNLVLLPLATIAVWAGFIGLIFGFVPFLSDLALFIMEGLLQIIAFLSRLIAELPGALVVHWNFSDLGFCILFTSTILILLVLNLKKGKEWIVKGVKYWKERKSN